MSTQSAPTYGTLPPTPTPTPTPTPNQPSQGIIEEIESYLAGYVSFADPAYAFVIALWLAATHTWLSFDAFPYLVVTSATKRSGKRSLGCPHFPCGHVSYHPQQQTYSFH
jgi:hypothetical protein